MGRHNHSSRHEHERKRGRHHNSKDSRKDSNSRRLTVLGDQQGQGWAGV